MFSAEISISQSEAPFLHRALREGFLEEVAGHMKMGTGGVMEV